MGFDDVRGLVRGIVLISLLDRGRRRRCSSSCGSGPGYGYDVGEAAWHGVFHSVSAFNNAGFALPATTSIAVRRRSVHLPADRAARSSSAGSASRSSCSCARSSGARCTGRMNTKLVLWGTVVLLVARHGATSPSSSGTTPARSARSTRPRACSPASSTSVQTRTAGFNSVDIGAMHDETWLGMDVLMFIGGGPAGTARRHQGHHLRRALLHHARPSSAARAAGEHLRQAALPGGAPPGDHGRARSRSPP